MADQDAEVQQQEPAAEPPASAEPNLADLQTQVAATQRQLAELQGQLKGRIKENERLVRDLRNRDEMVSRITEQVTANVEDRMAAALDEFTGANQEEPETQPVTASQRFKQRFKRQADTAQPAGQRNVPAQIQAVIDDLVDISTDAGLDVSNLPAALKEAQEDSRALLWSGRHDRAKAVWQKAVSDYAAANKAAAEKEATVATDKKVTTEKRQQLAANAVTDRKTAEGSGQRRWDKKSLESVMSADNAGNINEIAAALEESMAQAYAKRR